jgi:hypothetical protein
MDWAQFALFFIAVFGLFVWNRSESRTDIRHMDAKLESNRNLTIDFHTAIQAEMKDFHARLERIDAEFKANLLKLEEKKK